MAGQQHDLAMIELQARQQTGGVVDEMRAIDGFLIIIFKS
jgi:hypothetical protein